ncbi:MULTISPECIES: ornithine cyclodeaminase family protein [Streptomyces]|uniref:ornithine cyclodeaminase family protein n=1 Tax=Streptomyces TaxID=1883 RepID=UPI00200F9BE0|nr:ornithine cyclodeaminase family protein [Streptomyces sp. LRE541]UPZ32751.1 ornithine cyclodeaminase family protein [Streptomyces sp. LRE541]
MLELTGADVTGLLGKVDLVDVVREVFLAHANDRTVLPEESCLRWTNDQGESCRSLNMPGLVEIDGRRTAGTKIINASLGNPDRGLPRAGGIVLLFDVTTARLVCSMDAAHISAGRTAAVSVLAAELLWARPARSIGVVGAGALAEAHLDLALRRWPSVREVRLHDQVPERAVRLAERLGDTYRTVAFDVASTAERAVRDTELIIPVTTTTTGYIPADWIAPGTVTVNVSLDDLLPDAFSGADKVIVDDWSLVAADTTRLLGRMHRSGDVLPPPRHRTPTDAGRPAPAVEVAAELCDLISGAATGRRSAEERIVVNPFGMSLHDVAVAGKLYHDHLGGQDQPGRQDHLEPHDQRH